MDTSSMETDGSEFGERDSAGIDVGEPDEIDEAAFDLIDDDEKLPLVSRMVEALAEINGQVSDSERTIVFTVEEMKLDTPIELDVTMDESGRVELGGAPPTQHTETTIMPVFHRLSLRLVRDHDGS